MFAGIMPLLWDKNDLGGFFFWLVKQRGQPELGAPKKLIVWLNGGPGCSSMVGMMWENGPFTLEYGGMIYFVPFVVVLVIVGLD
jgi:carboxypeptidase D